MVTYDMKIIEGKPHLHLNIPLGAYLLDDEKVAKAKQIVDGIQSLKYGNVSLFVNSTDESDMHEGPYRLDDIIERYRSLYLLSLLEGVLNKVRPLKDPYIADIDEQLSPLLEQSKAAIKRRHSYV